MELKEFVKDTLLAIVTGVSECRTAGLLNGTYIGHGENTALKEEYVVTFDVALATTTGGKGGAKIAVAFPTIGEAAGEIGAGRSNTSTTRVQFQVPMTYPTTPRP